MGAAAAWAVPAGLGLVGSLIGNNSQNHATQGAANAAQQATNGQNALNNQQMALYQSMLDDYKQHYQPLEGGLSNQYGSLLGGLNMDQLAGSTLNAFGSPAGTDAMTGLPTQTLLHNDLSYLNQPGQTLSGLGGVGGAGLAYYLNQAQNGGIDPALINNALGQQQTGFDRSMSDLHNMLGTSSRDASMMNDAEAQNEQARASMLAQLTGQSQMLRNQGMGQALQTAGGIDQQTQQMLNQAYATANGASQQALGNLGQAYGMGMNQLGAVQNYVGQGRNFLPGVASGIGSMAQQYGQAAGNAANSAAYMSANQQNPFTSFASGLANNPGFNNWLGGLGQPKGGGSAPLPSGAYLGDSYAYGNGNPNAM